MTNPIGVGGYKILDLSAEEPFTTAVARNVPGAFKSAIESQPNKPVMVTGARVGAQTIPAFFAAFAYGATGGPGGGPGWFARFGQNGTMCIAANDQIVFSY